MLKLVTDGSIRGTTHPYVGQEAVAVGACLPLRRDDWVVSTHRGHGHLLAKGGDPNRLDGRAVRQGRRATAAAKAARSTWPTSPSASWAPTASPAAASRSAPARRLSAQMRGSGQVVVVFFGDGADQPGDLPRVAQPRRALAPAGRLRVREQRLRHVDAACTTRARVEHLADRAAAYGMPGVQADGMDVLAVAAAMRAAVERARAGRGPTLIECKTYRFLGHSKSDQRVYRSRDEEAAWRERDPIARFRAALLEQAWATTAELDAIAARSRRPPSTPRSSSHGAARSPTRGASPRACSPRRSRSRMRELTYWQALQEALREEMQRDPRVFLMGEDIGAYGGAFGVTRGLLDGVRPGARALHADLRGHHRRRRHRRGASPACGRWSRSCSWTSSPWPWTSSSTTPPSSATCTARRRACRW